MELFVSALVLLAAAGILWMRHEVNTLEISRFTVASPKLPAGFDGFTVVQLTDLHGKEFGSRNGRLIARVRALRPDVIVLTGDMINAAKNDIRVFLRLAPELVKICPVYYISGNHELSFARRRKRDYACYRRAVLAAGVKWINNQRVEICRGGGSIALYGLRVPYSSYRRGISRQKSGRGVLTVRRVARFIGCPRSDRFNLLLAHSPFFFPAYAQWRADLTLAGHVHGGIIRLPGLGGLFSPDRTLFTRYNGGLYQKGPAKMIVGRGLGTNHVTLRVNNRPEIVAVTLRSRKKGAK